MTWFSEAFGKVISAVYSEGVGQAIASVRDHAVLNAWFGVTKEPPKPDLGWTRSDEAGPEPVKEPQAHDVGEAKVRSAVYGEAIGQAFAFVRGQSFLDSWFGQSKEAHSPDTEQAIENSREQDRGIER